MWGDPDYGGDLTSRVASGALGGGSATAVDLSAGKVKSIGCGGKACWAIFLDGSATPWGGLAEGGDVTRTDNGRVVDLSSNVKTISCGTW